MTSPRPADAVVIIDESCLAHANVVCRSCSERCEHNAIRFSPRLGGAATPAIEAARCTACGECLPVCPANALRLIPLANSTRLSEEFVA